MSQSSKHTDRIDGSRFKFRLRVWLGTKLGLREIERWFKFQDFSVRLTSETKGEPIRESHWLVFTAGNFEKEEAARAAGEDLRRSILAVGAFTRNGINLGHDQNTTWISEEWAKSLGLLKEGERLWGNVHGLMIFPDDDLNRVPSGSPTIDVHADAEAFLAAVSETAKPPAYSPSVREALVLFNLALLNPQPIARLAICLSAVEALGQTEEWSAAQQNLLNRLAIEAASDDSLEQEQADEVANALRRGLHRIGLRQGVIRVLTRLNLEHLKKEWDRIYGVRSGIFHGTKVLGESETAAVANDAITLTRTIVLTLAKNEGLSVSDIALIHFPSLNNGAIPN